MIKAKKIGVSIAAVALAAVVGVSSLLIAPNFGEEPVLTGLQTISDDVYYYDEDGVQLYGWHTIDGNLYYFESETGRAKIGWFTDEDGAIYYCGVDGAALTGAHSIDSVSYTFGTDGRLMINTGPEGYTWEVIKGQTYCLDSNGDCLTGLKRVEGALYFFNEKGVRQTGWHKIKEKIYYFDEYTGKAAQGWLTKDGETYYFSKEGYALTGGQKIGGKSYAFDSDGHLARKETFKLDSALTQTASGGVTEVAKSTGDTSGSAATEGNSKAAEKPAAVKGDWEARSGGRYYTDKYGKKVTGLKTIDGDIYYFNKTGLMQTGWQIVKGRRYCFDESGRAMTGWISGSDNTYYLCKAGYTLTGLQTLDSELFFFDAEGVLQTGVQVVNGKVYCFSGNQGEAVSGWVEEKISSGTVTVMANETAKYYFGKDGLALTGSQTIEGQRYIFNATTGRMLTGWQEVDGKLYYLGTDGIAAKSCWLQHDDGMVYLGKDGAALTGLQTIEGQVYAFSNQGFRLSGWATLAEGRYCFEGENDTALKNTWKIEGETKLYLGDDGKACTGMAELPSEEDNDTRETYLFDGNGALLAGKQWNEGGRLQIPDDNGIIKFGWLESVEDTYYIGEDGFASTGVASIGGALYGFDDQGIRQNGIIEKDGKVYGFFGVNDEAVLGFYTLGVSTYYFGEDFTAQMGICTIGEDGYCFDAKGVMQTGWQTDEEGNLYYFGRDGKAAKGWFTDIGQEAVFYFSSKGQAVTGEKNIEGVSYFFDDQHRLTEGSPVADAGAAVISSGDALYGYTDGGEALNGWYRTGTGKKYYFGGEDGRALFGWQTLDGNRYYFDVDGMALTGLARIAEEDGTHVYSFDEEGKLSEGEKNIAGLNFSFNSEDNGRAREGWYPAAGEAKARYYGPDGYALSGVQEIEGETYWFDDDGAQRTGWLADNRTYGFLGEKGEALKGTQEVNTGKTYVFEKNGVAKTGFYRDGDGVRYYGHKGLSVTGWTGRYYFDENGLGAEGITRLSDSYTYCFSGGYALTGTVQMGKDATHTLDAKGVLINTTYAQGGYSWMNVDGNVYYLDTAGNKKTGLQTIEGSLYYLEESGVDKGARQSGWNTVGGKTYYFSKSTGRALTGWFVQSGKTYHFAENGVLSKGAVAVDGRDCIFDKSDGHQLISVAASENILASDTRTAASVDTAAFKQWGIDVSQWQGQINWKKVANSGVKFAIVRSLTWSRDVGYYVIDPYFDYNIRMAKANGIKVGTYLYSYAYSKADMKEEINYFFKSKEIKGLLNDGIYFDLPVYIDYEDPLVINNTAHLTKAQRTAIVKYGMDLISSKSSNKFMPGFYTYYSFAKNIIDGASLQRQGYEFWIAYFDVSHHGWNPDPPIWQYTSSGSVSGISGRVDLNYAYKDYSKYINPGKKVVGALARKLTVTNQNGKKVTDTALNIISQVVNAEVGGFGQTEVYKAQAVAAQTYILYRQSKGIKAPQVNLKSSPSDELQNAVYSVLNEKMTYNGKLAFTPYFSWSNGQTNSSASAWGTSLAYLTSVNSPETKASGTTKGTITTANLKKRIEAVYGQGVTKNYEEKDWITITSTNSAGYVTGITVCGRNPTVEYFYTTLLRYTSGGKVVTPVKSASFTIAYNTGEWTFISKGSGHCVGMSQYGASALASNGESYSTILKTYYVGVSIADIS